MQDLIGRYGGEKHLIIPVELRHDTIDHNDEEAIAT